MSDIRVSPEQLVFYDGWEAFERDEPRQTESTITGQETAQSDWIAGWDAAKEEAESNKE